MKSDHANDFLISNNEINEVIQSIFSEEKEGDINKEISNQINISNESHINNDYKKVPETNEDDYEYMVTGVHHNEIKENKQMSEIINFLNGIEAEYDDKHININSNLDLTDNKENIVPDYNKINICNNNSNIDINNNYSNNILPNNIDNRNIFISINDVENNKLNKSNDDNDDIDDIELRNKYKEYLRKKDEELREYINNQNTNFTPDKEIIEYIKKKRKNCHFLKLFVNNNNSKKSESSSSSSFSSQSKSKSQRSRTSSVKSEKSNNSKIQNSFSDYSLSFLSNKNVKSKNKKLKKSKNNKELSLPINTTCSICLEDIIDLANPSNCNHNFCKNCLLQWATESCNLCPLCKKSFSKIYVYDKNKRIEIAVKFKKQKEVESVEEDINNICVECNEEDDVENLIVCCKCKVNCIHKECMKEVGRNYYWNNNNSQSVPNWICNTCKEEYKRRRKNVEKLLQI